MQETSSDFSQCTAQLVSLQELDAGSGGANLCGGNLELIRNLRVRLQVAVGGVEMAVGELFALQENAVLTLDRQSHEPLDIMLDGKIIARGNLVVVEDNFGISITEIMALPAP